MNTIHKLVIIFGTAHPNYRRPFMKIAVFVLLLMLYPLFLRLIHISDLRAIPLVVPYALASLSFLIIGSELLSWLFKKKK